MKNVKIKSLTLNNYRCFSVEREFHAGFGEKTRVSGKNGSGKSTVMNAVMEVLTGKNADGTQPDNVRPVVYGKELEGVDVVRSLVLDINGTETEIKKITKQKKEKVDGVSQYVPGSNVNSYEVDGIFFTQKKFSDFIEENICKPDMMTACCNPNTFLSIKSTTDQRAFLENMTGFDLQEYIKSLGSEFTEVEAITKGHAVEQVQKTLNKQLSDQKKKTDRAETTWKYEKSRQPEKSEAEISELQKSVDEYNKQIAELDKKEKALDEAVKSYDEKSQNVLDLKFEQSEIVRKANEGIVSRKKRVNEDIFLLSQEKRNAENDLRMAEMDLKHANMGIERHTAEVKKAQEDYSRWISQEFDDSEIAVIESEVFNEDSLICPTCGQEFPENKAEKIREDFEKSKALRIEGVKAAGRNYEEMKDREIQRVTESGNKAATYLKEAKKAEEEAERKISEIKKSISDLALKTAEKKKELSELPEEVDLSGDTEYNAISAQIEAAQKSLETMDNGSSERAEITEKRNAYIRESAKLAAEINKIQSDHKKHEEQVEKLYAEYRESSQLEADIQRKKDILKNFSIKKNERIAEMINPNFTEFQFEFLDYTQDGTPIECCNMVSNGIEYKDMNHSKKILVQADLVKGFQKIQGINLPVFLDDTESLDSTNIPKNFDGQLILLKVQSPMYLDDNKKLREVDEIYNPDIHKIVDDGHLRVEAMK